MNRTSCQNQRMQGSMSQQMRTRNTFQSYGRAPQQTPRNDRECNPVEKDRSCGCSEGTRYSHKNDWRQEVPTESRSQLLNYINEVSFGAYEALLYLDTHPNCPDGLRYFKENNEKRQFALKEYSRLYGPLNLDRVQVTCDTPSWEWVNQPWPWEGGAC